MLGDYYQHNQNNRKNKIYSKPSDTGSFSIDDKMKFKTSRNILRIKITPDLHLTYSKNGGNLVLVLKMKNIACLSILLTKHVKYLYLFKFVLYIIVAFKAN